MNYALIFIGGGLGALLRYLSTLLLNGLVGNRFALGTLFVNCAGALAAGFLIGTLDLLSTDPKWKLFLLTGFLGGYTTFSAYSLETAQYIANGNIKLAAANILLNNALCIALVFLGAWGYRAMFAR